MFYTKFRPGDLVRDRITGDEGVIVKSQAEWYDKYNSLIIFEGDARKPPKSLYYKGVYGIHQKTKMGSLNGYWYDDDQIELVKKGFLY